LTDSARKIRASELLKDVLAGLNDFQIMAKHAINAKQLEYLFHKMSEAGLITRKQLDSRTSLAETSITKAFVDVQRSIENLDDNDETDSESVYRNVLRDFSAQESRYAQPAQPSESRARKIRANELVKDVTCGLSDPALMAKYRLQPNQLEFMLRKLVEAGRVTETQLVERTRITSTSITKAFVDVYQSLRELDEGDWGDRS
jgi:DNA-binding HxlR family transcriptional regulator